jgi:biopolymer transport protein ExbD
LEFVIQVWFSSPAQGSIKMGYDNQPRSSSLPVVAIVLLLIFMVLGGMVVVGVGTWFLVRSRRAEQVATVERHRAIQAEQMARAIAVEAAEAARAQADQARQLAAEAKAELTDKPVPVRQVNVELDKAGKLKLDGEAIELAALLDRLKALAADKTTSITVEMRADEKCPFQHVADLIAACQKLGITRFRFGTLDAAIAEEPAENKTPATVIE